MQFSLQTIVNMSPNKPNYYAETGFEGNHAGALREICATLDFKISATAEVRCFSLSSNDFVSPDNVSAT